MAKRRLEMFSHLPETVQKMYELEDDEEIVNFVDHFAEGGPVVHVKTKRSTEEERRRNRERVYEVCGEIIYELALERQKKSRRSASAAAAAGSFRTL